MTDYRTPHAGLHPWLAAGRRDRARAGDCNSALVDDMSEKPVRIEINDSGAWRVIGRFDAADEEQTGAILDAAEHLAHALGWQKERCPTLRVSIDAITVLMHWTRANGWRDAETGDPA